MIQKTNLIVKCSLLLMMVGIPKFLYPQIVNFGALVPSDTIKISSKSIYTNQDKVYVVTNQNEILSISKDGQIFKRYSNNYLGTPHFIYYQNPLQLVLFYPAYQTIIILDHSFNELTRISLSTLNIPFVPTIGLTPNREIIYFDTNSQILNRTNYITKINIPYIRVQTEDNPMINAIMSHQNEVLVLSAQELWHWDATGFSKDRFDGQIVKWEDGIMLFYKLTPRSIISKDGNTFTQTQLPDAFGDIIQVALLSDGILGLDITGQLVVFRVRP